MSNLFWRSLRQRPFLYRQMATAAGPVSRRSRPLSALTILALSTTGYALGSVYPPSPISLLFPRPAPPPPDPNSDEGVQQVEELEKQLQSLPILQELRTRPDRDQWYESRPYTNFPEEVRVNHLTAGTLRGPGKITLRPIAMVKNDESEAVFVIHLGRALCGHDGIIHGGLLATILDETLARVAIANLQDRVGVTATLNIKYKAPTKADQFIVARIYLKEVNGKKAFVTGRIEDLEGKLLVEADAMFVQPRYSKLLKNNALLKAMQKSEEGATNNPRAALT